MTSSEPWDRATNGWQHAVVAIVLALPTLSALIGAHLGPGGLALRLGLVLALGGWYAYWFVIRHGDPAGLPYLIGAAALWAAMSAVDPALLAVGAAMVVPYCLRRVVLAAALVVAIAVVWLGQRLFTGHTLTPSSVLTCLLGVLTAISIAGYIATLHRESLRRQRLLDELAAAQAELAAAERRNGILTERQRLARDIHDTLTQGFASIALHLDAAGSDLPPGGPATERVNTALRTARENLAESRRLINELRPVRLDNGRLPHALRGLTVQLAGETGLTAQTVITGAPLPLSPNVEAQIVRVVQEALTNVRRHAAATEVTVTLSYVDELVAVDVTDNGTGMSAGGSGGVGLAGMRERVDGIGGTLVVESAPGEGTTVAVSVPVVAR